MPDAQIIQLFQRARPPAEDSEFWEWGKRFVADGILNLVSIVEDMESCETEEAFRRCVQELKEEVETWPTG